MNFLVKCKNKDCAKYILVDSMTVFENLIFSEMAKIITCPVCGAKTMLTLEIKLVEGDK